MSNSVWSEITMLVGTMVLGTLALWLCGRTVSKFLSMLDAANFVREHGGDLLTSHKRIPSYLEQESITRRIVELENQMHYVRLRLKKNILKKRVKSRRKNE